MTHLIKSPFTQLFLTDPNVSERANKMSVRERIRYDARAMTFKISPRSGCDAKGSKTPKRARSVRKGIKINPAMLKRVEIRAPQLLLCKIHFMHGGDCWFMGRMSRERMWAKDDWSSCTFFFEATI